MNFLVDFVLIKKMTEEEKKTITRGKHPGRVAQGHKLAARMKKRKEEILRSKDLSTEQGKEQSTEQGKEQSTEQGKQESTEQGKQQSTEQGKQQSTEQGKEQSVLSNDTYVNGVGILVVLAIDVCVFLYITLSLKIKNEPIKKGSTTKTTSYTLRKIYTMSDCQENIKKPIEDEPTKAAEKPIGDRPFTAFATATAFGIFFVLRAMGMRQHDALVTSTSLVWLFSLLVWER